MSSDIDRLRQILASMDLPRDRVETLDKGWILRNIGIRNGSHPDLDEAVALLRRL